ncbi:MAG: ATP-binding protein [Ktedonobacteraceae bacterium]|nr:ATP-binding protein [Ktedonobacteraceae bacterium]
MIDGIAREEKAKLFPELFRVEERHPVLLCRERKARFYGVDSEVVQDYQASYPRRDIALELSPEQEALPARIDRDRIGQVLGNYLTNAIKYSPADQPVHVGLVTESSVIRVWVRDHGPGLPTEEQQRIWEQFYRAPDIQAQNGSGASLGLGLYICQKLIHSHQGQVGMESAPGQGATFWFTLPRLS